MPPKLETNASPVIDDTLPFATSLQLVVGQASEKGHKSQNEDAIGIRIPSGVSLMTKGIVSVISDGVSTAEGGAQASAISVSNFLADYYSTPDSWSVQTSSAKVLTALNRWLYGLGQDYRDARRGFVCTFSALVFKSCTVHMLHVGDSRVYRFRRGELSQLSHDHSTKINSSHQYLTRALGMDVKLDVDYKALTVEQDDLYLLTTDGIHDQFTEFELLQKISSFYQLHPQLSDDLCEQFCHKLIKKAFELGSKDNLSAQLLCVQQLPKQAIDDVYHHLSQRPFPPPLSVGMKLDGYQVTHIIHQSQRSQVYRVENNQQQAFCMKTPSVNYIDDAAYIERFMLESWIGQRINSTHVVKVVEQHKPKSALYYLTEYLTGVSLAQWLVQHKKAPVEDVLLLLKQIELGVRAFHRRETLHQDLKPDNIFITRDGVVKIIDFGSCYIKGVAEISTPLTRDHILGTADYTAPEVILGFQADGRADLFSLAVIAYEMLAGESPFKGKLSKCNTRQAFSRLEYVNVHQLNPMVPIWIDQALKKALSIEPNLRQADTCEFIHQLTTASAQQRPKHFVPLINRNPVRFWQATSIVLLLALITSLLV
ncbi:bifunctional protein-serine/threonine kinase/phosphatase [Shewanella ulleungensis]|jgi:serine/threonine protein phosphatase PrpC|uniref:non-specific serine/threonine protein kinase n=1 Tax=Shewanella ulleungensis TaxID=2282699 RepID=A0ABQ2QJN8_9GAMM|nr:bifunctional protein-serine/threonine kinase/phosphatase [Shewanella ulleungensis]MCL1151854.1 bifunctional protein-serine/threonine kinase/phosphatase [Shewanella ulleungensis]GGP83536.1 protein kinase [Shewanella ulleungensis]|tara:strand:- start:13228 stop:15015 length:1788 start_codon:yes stop_codon:yes gene_type:complete